MDLLPGEYTTILEDLQKQQKELEQSLKYASYIQQALFPKPEEINQVFPENFLAFLPRDIVSGDFYWIHRETNRIIIAVGDSTGHGVPGAFISILGISFLNLVISKYKPGNPAAILNYLREYFMKALNQTGKDEEQKDGLDISLCIIDLQAKMLQYAGAFNPMYVIRNKELFQIDGDKMPIGVSAEFENSFTFKQFDLIDNDMIYLFTDGFPDQFGGEQGKKYKYRNFRNLLLECSPLSMAKQKEKLIDEFTQWRGNNSQIDDMTILGIRYRLKF
jgi:serine phosphatase RsbU (regulator of sigma subunit)